MIVESVAVAMIAALISSVSPVQSAEVDDMAVRRVSNVRRWGKVKMGIIRGPPLG